MGQNGGVRAGAGRKPLAVKHKTAIEIAERKIKDRLPEIVDAQITLALGVTVQEMTEDGGRIYTKPPSYRSCEYLMNRIMGKPVERIKHNDDSGGTLVITRTDQGRVARILSLVTGGEEETPRRDSVAG